MMVIQQANTGSSTYSLKPYTFNFEFCTVVRRPVRLIYAGFISPFIFEEISSDSISMIHFRAAFGNNKEKQEYDDDLTVVVCSPQILRQFWEFPLLIKQMRKKQKEFLHLLVAGGHGDECQDQVQSGRRQGDGEEGEEEWSWCEFCLFLTEF